jgi:hypothetical protein
LQPAEKISEKQAALPPPKPKAAPPAEPEAPAETKAAEPPAEEPKEKAAAEAPPMPTREERPKPRPEKAEQRPEPKPQREAKREPQREAKPRPRPANDRIADLLDKPTPPAEGESEFDPKRIAALLNRDPTAGGLPRDDAPREPWRRPSSLQEQALGAAPDAPRQETYGAREGRDSRMSASDVDAFRAQISRCWTPPVGGLGRDALIVKLRIGLNEDGTLTGPPEVSNSHPSPFFRPAADSAVRAVFQCQPYRMPPEKYGQWRDMLLNFDPSRMYGG